MNINTTCPHCKESEIIEVPFEYLEKLQKKSDVMELTILCHECLKNYYMYANIKIYITRKKCKTI